jgi:histidine triad (HIT) family protein
MPTIFSKIISGEIPCYKIAENSDFLAFLDINPLAPGHTLVIPKKEVDYIFNIDDELYAGLWKFAKQVAPAVEKAVPCKRIGIAVIGLEVAHAHIHLIPITNVDQINFSQPKLKLSPEELSETAEKIKAFLKL